MLAIALKIVTGYQNARPALALMVQPHEFSFVKVSESVDVWLTVDDCAASRVERFRAVVRGRKDEEGLAVIESDVELSKSADVVNAQLREFAARHTIPNGSFLPAMILRSEHIKQAKQKRPKLWSHTGWQHFAASKG